MIDNSVTPLALALIPVQEVMAVLALQLFSALPLPCRVFLLCRRTEQLSISSWVAPETAVMAALVARQTGTGVGVGVGVAQ